MGRGVIAIRTVLAVLTALQVLAPTAGGAQLAPFRVSWISPTRAAMDRPSSTSSAAGYESSAMSKAGTL